MPLVFRPQIAIKYLICSLYYILIMKRLILFSIFTLELLKTYSQTNVYFPFPDSNAVWCDSAGFNQQVTISCGISSYAFNGDTVVNAKTYHKLHIIGMSYYVSISHCSGGNPYPPYSAYAGAIRQDIVEKKVYFLPPSATRDSLLYNFSLGVGDTLRTYVT